MSPPRVYTCFDASGSKNPALTDLKYYFLLRAWSRRAPLARSFVDVHGAAARAPKPADLRNELVARLRNSDLLLLLLSERSPNSRGWLSWEIEFAVQHCELPIVCAYTGHGQHNVEAHAAQRGWWPDALRLAAASGRARLHHVPFQPDPLARAFSHAPS